MELRWYQREAVTAAMEHLKVGLHNGNPVICAPTGSGKSLMIAELARATVQDYGGQALVLAHRKELLQQNAEKIAALLPFGVTCGIYSAGLRRYSMDEAVVCCGIQSVYKKAAAFGRRHLVIVDEAHLIPETEDGMYRKFLSDLKELNPKLRIVGLTATPYRTGEGTICKPENIFHKICYNVPIQRLIMEGFLCPITSKVATNELDTSKLHKRGGEFIESEMQSLFDGADKVLAACQEIAEKTVARHSVIVFCAGVIHAGHVAEMLRKLTGERTEVITGETLPIEREAFLAAFKRREIKYLANVDVLTTGFDAPCIDAIAVLRATASPGLFAQIVGRGLRTHDSKSDCLVLDFGENIKRHGAIDSDDYGKKKERITTDEREPSDGVPGKTCPGCGNECAGNTRQCECGYLFPANHEATSAREEILSKPKRWQVLGMSMCKWRKKTSVEGAPDTLRVDYKCTPVGDAGMLLEQTISEWICLEHAEDSWAYKNARKWLAKHTNAIPEDEGYESLIDKTIELFNRGAFAEVIEITTVKEKQWHRITARELGARPLEWQALQEPIGYDEWGSPIYDEPLPEQDFEDEELPF